MSKFIILFLVNITIFADISTITLENDLIKKYDKFEKWTEYSSEVFHINNKVSITFYKKIQYGKQSGVYIELNCPYIHTYTIIKILFDNNKIITYKLKKTNSTVIIKIHRKDMKLFKNTTINSIRITDSDSDFDLITKNSIKNIFTLFSTIDRQ